jgi:DNA-binding SARP family transcriptional activator
MVVTATVAATVRFTASSTSDLEEIPCPHQVSDRLRPVTPLRPTLALAVPGERLRGHSDGASFQDRPQPSPSGAGSGRAAYAQPVRRQLRQVGWQPRGIKHLAEVSRLILVEIWGSLMKFRVLGPLEVHVGDAVVPVGGPRQRKALAALLLAANRTVSLARLVCVVWDRDPPTTAIEQVQNCLSSLRRTLTAAGRAPGTLGLGPGGYRLVVDDCGVDATRFEAHLAAGRRRAAAGDLVRALAEVSAGLELWRGPALAGVSSAALEPASSRLEDRRLSACEERARLRIALDDHEVAAFELSMLCAEHPLREQLYGLRMLALRGAGRRAEALQVFRVARETLRRELGLDPGRELRDLERLVLTED